MFTPPRHLLSFLVNPEVRVCLILIRTSYRITACKLCHFIGSDGRCCMWIRRQWLDYSRIMIYISIVSWYLFFKLMNDGFYLTIVNMFIYIRTFSNATNSCRGTSLLVLTGNKQRIMKVNGYYFIMKIATSWEWFQCLELFFFCLISVYNLLILLLLIK